MLGLAILLGFNYIGLWVKEWTHIPLPANIIGLMLFTGSLFAGIVKLEWVESTSQFLTKHMMLFFIPYLVGTIVFFPLIRAHFFMLSVSLTLSTFMVLAVTGWVTAKLLKPASEGESDHG